MSKPRLQLRLAVGMMVLAFLSGACGSSASEPGGRPDALDDPEPTSTSTIPPESGIRGTVSIEPGCPDDAVEARCEQRLAIDAEVFIRMAPGPGESSFDRPIEAADYSDQNGAFEFRVLPGTWLVEAAAPPGTSRCEQVIVEVGVDAFVEVTIVCSPNPAEDDGPAGD